MSVLQAAQLVGAWTLLAWEIAYDDGRPVACPYGSDALGQLLYSADGRMSATISRADRPRLSTEALRKAPETEKAAAFESYFHYAGRWHLDGDSVIHDVTLALNPGFVASAQRRQATLEGDRLTLSTADRVAGVTRTHRLLWRRVQD